jgi:hypothetical protein
MMSRFVGAVLVAALSLSACSNEPAQEQVPTSKGAPTPGQDLFPVVASSEISVGVNRLQIGLLNDKDAPVRSPKTTLEVDFVGPDDDRPSTSSTMSFLWTIKPVQGLWVGKATFDQPGQWKAVIDVEGGGYDGTVRTVFDVKKEGTTPDIGEKAPIVDTPTASDVADLSKITTDPDPSRRFYNLSIAEALEADKPAVIVFATPQFCTSQVCGPTLSIVKDVAREFPHINFVHVEPYDLDKVPEKLEPVPAVTAWGLPSEPWVFVTDQRGRVVAKYEGSVAAAELADQLQSL